MTRITIRRKNWHTDQNWIKNGQRGKEVFRIHKSKDIDNTMANRKGSNNELQALHRKLKIEWHEPHKKPGVNTGAPEGLAVPAPPVVLLFHDTNIIWYDINHRKSSSRELGKKQRIGLDKTIISRRRVCYRQEYDHKQTTNCRQEYKNTIKKSTDWHTHKNKIACIRRIDPYN